MAVLLLAAWFCGSLAYWLGALLARSSGYPLSYLWTPAGFLLVAASQAWSLSLPGGRRPWVGALVLGLLPTWLGFFLVSGHWVSELWILAAFLSLASLNTLTAAGWQATTLPARQRLTQQVLGFTLSNILLIAGLVWLYYLPPPPLPARQGIWLLVALAVVNQEFIKRRFYLQAARLPWLRTGVAGFQLGLVGWLLLVYLLRQ